jgi:hypothetical protein
MNLRDVRMIERAEDLGFPLKSRKSVRIARERVGQNFNRHLALQPRIARAIHLAHTACANERDDFVRAESRPRIQCHRSIRNLPTRQSANLPMPRVSAATPMPPAPISATIS